MVADEDLPLAGLRVLDVSGLVAGPFCAMVLGDWGGDVVKVESLRGDVARTLGGQMVAPDVSAVFVAANRGKRSVALDLRSDRGRGLLRRLALASDVVVHNHRPDAARRLGVDQQALAAEKPEIIVANVSAFGEEGPYAGRSALDPVAQAMSGMMSLTGAAAGPPMRAGPPVVDFGTGMTLAAGVLAALCGRQRTGRGRAVTASLLEVALMFNSSMLSLASVLGSPPPRLENRSHPIVADQFATRDGFVVLAVWEDRRFRALCELLGVGELAGDPGFASNELRLAHYDRLGPALQDAIAPWTAGELVEALAPLEIPCAKTCDLAEVASDPQVVASGALYDEARLERPVRMTSGPLRFDGQRPRRSLPPPRLGEHTREVLGELLGVGEGGLGELAAAGVIGGREAFPSTALDRQRREDR